MSWGVLALLWLDAGASWRDLGVALGRFRSPSRANLETRGPLYGPSWAQHDHLDATWAAMLMIIASPGRDICENLESQKTDDGTTFLLHF